MSDIRVIIGLGNPGKEYADTRHNVGFKTVDLLAQKLAVELNQKKFSSIFGQTEFEGKKLILLKPQEYMNRSGQAVSAIKGFYKIEDSDLMVVTDDMAIEPGVIRVRAQGSAGGHNGLKDIIQKLGSDQFPRLRIGIGKSDLPDSKDYVLGKIPTSHNQLLQDAIENASQALICWLRENIDSVMNRFNVKNNEEN
jgi:PTH1 family peptidyl-tRNA hydrolase